MNLGDLIKRLAGFKGIGFVILALVAGVLLIIWPDSDASKSASASTPSSVEYASSAEKQARELIKQIDGVKSCEIMITLSDGYSYLYASDQQVKSDGVNRDVAKQVVIITSDGRQNPVIICEYTPKIAGIGVVYDGDFSAAERIKTLLAVLFGLSDEYIYVTT